MDYRLIKFSKSLSWLLRHHATDYNLNIEEDGYVPLSEILNLDFKKVSFKGCSEEDIITIVDNDNKQRFSLIDKEGIKYIRANQGHSHSVGSKIKDELLLSKILTPMDYCVHGTTIESANIIKKSGLKKMRRKHIHFSSSPNAQSGIRYNAKVLIHCNMDMAMKDGIEFWLSDNDVILSSNDIDPKYLTFEYL